jgi:hypothetical protein
LKEVLIPESVTRVGSNAFWGCCNLEEIVLPSSVNTIGDRAFFSCDALKKIVIKGTKTKISIPILDTDTVTIHAPAGSYAEQYAKENNIPFVAE